jgi:hypothetical protein
MDDLFIRTNTGDWTYCMPMGDMFGQEIHKATPLVGWFGLIRVLYVRHF